MKLERSCIDFSCEQRYNNAHARLERPPFTLCVNFVKPNISMAATWKVTLLFVAVVHLLPSCMPAVTHVLEPLIITIAKDGSDVAACLSGKVPCKTFRYAVGEDSSGVDGKGGDVIMIITYTQTLSILTNNYFIISRSSCGKCACATGKLPTHQVPCGNFKMATLALVTLVCLLYSCAPAVSSEPLIITITKDGTDEAACLSGKVPCKTFDYAIQYIRM